MVLWLTHLDPSHFNMVITRSGRRTTALDEGDVEGTEASGGGFVSQRTQKVLQQRQASHARMQQRDAEKMRMQTWMQENGKTEADWKAMRQQKFKKLMALRHK